MSLKIEKTKQLRSSLKGNLLLPEDPAYEEARKIWNGMFDKRPALIVQCKETGDVVKAVKYAGMNNMALSVKGGGHNSAGTASVDGGMMVDLSLMQEVEVNAGKKTASVQGGCLLGTVDSATQKFGLAVSSGIISHTGVGGLTLGGGMGWISRKHGFSVDNLISAEVVTAKGNIVRASEIENPDLFWGLRGGGGNFGIVTKFEFQCADIGTEVYSGPVVKRFEDVHEYIKFHREYVRTMPDEMTIWLVIRHAPPLPFLSEEVHGKMVVLVPFVYLGDPEKGRELMQPIRDFGETLGDGSAMHPWVGWQSAFDGLVDHGARNYWKSHHIRELSDECIDTIVDFAAKMPTGECEVFIPHMEGAPGRVNPGETAYSLRESPFVLNIHTRWRDAADDERCREWARNFFESTKPYSQGVYVNFISDEDYDRTKEAYTPDAWQKLVNVKKTWDAGNFFRINQNIRPNGIE
ncbi:MAG TPA: FAD-binding oxidoreductase [Bacteroidales bacterium]|nr:FAD-binding oxidoreductase [Bacteroidales bacterium]